MSSDTASAANPAIFAGYTSRTAEADRHPAYMYGAFFRHCTAALTLVTALSGFGMMAGGTSAANAATNSLTPPLQLWRSSRAALTQAEIDLLTAKLDRLKKYRSGWAGPGSQIPTKRAFNLAGDFIHYIAESGMRPPTKINLSSDGEINFYWKRAQASLDLGINRRSRISYFAKLPNGALVAQDSKPYLPKLSSEILNAFN